MTLRTPEQLKAMFQASRERKQKEREQHKKDRQQQYQALCKAADQLLKEDRERLKKERMEQLYTLSEKCRQNQRKQPYINLDTNRWIDGNYTMDYTRDELEQLCPHCINWDVWDKVVEQTRQQLGITDTKPLKHKKKRTRLWTYDTTGNLINEYFDCSIAAREFNLTVGTIHEYSEKRKTIKGITFSNRPLEL